MSDEGAPEPVFVIGAARSGTKFIRDTLAHAPGVAVVPWDINFVWRQGNEAVPHDELDPSLLDDGLSARIRRDVRRQAKVAGGSAPRVFVEKTVSNTLRVPFVHGVFPDARYIQLVRDGREVVESAYRCWQERPDWRYLVRKARSFRPAHWRYALRFAAGLFGGGGSGPSRRTWGPVYRGMREDLGTEPLEVVVARQWARCVTASLEGLATLPPDRVLTIRFEDMTASPDWIPEALRFIGRSEGVDSVVARYCGTVRRPDDDRWTRTFPEEQRHRVWREIEAVAAEVGYRA